MRREQQQAHQPRQEEGRHQGAIGFAHRCMYFAGVVAMDTVWTAAKEVKRAGSSALRLAQASPGGCGRHQLGRRLAVVSGLPLRMGASVMFLIFQFSYRLPEQTGRRCPSNVWLITQTRSCIPGSGARVDETEDMTAIKALESLAL
jgi:hypothetical protein